MVWICKVTKVKLNILVKVKVHHLPLKGDELEMENNLEKYKYLKIGTALR